MATPEQIALMTIVDFDLVAFEKACLVIDAKAKEEGKLLDDSWTLLHGIIIPGELIDKWCCLLEQAGLRGDERHEIY